MNATIKSVLRSAIRRLPGDLRYTILREMARTLNVAAIEVVGRNGAISGSPEDLTVMRRYAQRGGWEEHQVAWSKGLLANGGTFIDVGANIGTLSVPAGRLPGVTVLAIEPEPGNYAQLCRNIAGNDLQRARTFNVGLSDRPGSARMGKSAGNFGDHRLSMNGEDSGREMVQVDLMPLDDLVSEHELKHGMLARPLVLKIDVQGAEPFVLAGGQKTLAGADALMIEYGPEGIVRLGGDPKMVIDAISGFRLGAAFQRWSPIPPLGPIAGVIDLLRAIEPGRELDVVAVR